ncbi:MAG: alkane 1-monooxygenase, partial [Pseudomonadota bacterium]
FVATTHDGGEIRYVDRKRWLWVMSTLTPAVPTAGAVIMLSTGNLLWAAFPILFYFGFIPIIDSLIGEDPNNPPEAVVEQMAEDQHYRRLLFVAAGVLWLNFLAVAWVVGSQALPFWAAALLTVSAGVASGSGLTVAHELGHKPNRVDQWGAKMVAAISGYAHFMIEHNRGHHVHVATPEDAASARLGESLWVFATREIPHVARRGWQMEATRLEKKSLPVFSRHNDLLQGYAITGTVALVLVAAFGPAMLAFLVLHHLVAWFQLTMANYVEHYGLKRQRKDNGRYEPCQPHHSWNTNHIFSNLMLFHLQRHSDHHTNPLVPYQSLRNFEALPHLPSGYPGSFLLAAIPPLWRKVMDPKVAQWADGDASKCNITPGMENHYALAFQKISA